MPLRSARRTVSVAPMEPAAAPRWLRPLLLTLAAILLLSLFTGEIRDTDIWLHLKTGQHSWDTRALSVPDPFSYTSGMGAAKYPGEEVTRYFNLTHEWLAQIIMYSIYSVAGFPGLVLARAALLMVFCALAGWMAFGRTNDFYISLAAALACAAMAFHFQQSRPFLVTFLCLAVTMAILESRRSGLESRPSLESRRLWALPAVFLIWSNCHAGFFLGWLVAGAYCGEAAIERLRKRPVPNERQLWLVAVACFLVSGLNPNGFRVIQILFLYRSSGIQSENLEWQRPVFWEPGIYSLLLFGSLLALVFARRRTRPVDWLLYFGFALISLTAVRNTIFIGLIGPVLIAAYVPKSFGPKGPWRALPAVVALLATAALLVSDVAPAIARGNAFAWHAANWQLPSGAADFIQARRITGRMFNNYETGGYLVWRLWPMQRDFIDPRGLSEEVYADYKRILTNADSAGGLGTEKLLQKYGIQMVVAEGFDYLSGQVYPLVVELADSGSTEWTLAFADSVSVVFMRRPPPAFESGNSEPRNAASRNAMEMLLESLEKQCAQHIQHDPARPWCARGLSEVYAFKGNVEQGRRWMEYYLEHSTGPDPEAEQTYQSLRVTSLNNTALSLQSKGDLGAAEPLFRSALAIAEKTLGPDHPDTAGSLNNLAGLLELQGDYAGAEPLYRRALAIAEKTLGPNHPNTAMALDNLAGVLESEGDDAGAEPLYRRALSTAEKALGPDHPTTREIREDLDALVKRRAK
ncbi:MAG TPA: tetratricopeptide repeat protein [Candidatus Acidoferrales bacterium]|nr:tetratricopeptide repeat protein [Candidatus Acidoferrales bacterium]